ncbi:Dna topoisomerase 3-alpha, partial [Thalictrum thalictroides]
AIVQEQQGHPLWGSYAQRLLDPEEGLWKNPRIGTHSDNAHPPIYPTKFSAGESRWTQDHHASFPSRTKRTKLFTYCDLNTLHFTLVRSF